jgi:hypothetical protein
MTNSRKLWSGNLRERDRTDDTDNIKMGFKKTEEIGLDHVTQDRDQWWLM